MDATLAQVQSQIALVRSSKGIITTNCFTPLREDVHYEMFSCGKAVAFAYDDQGVRRVFFVSGNDSDLVAALERFTPDSLIEIVSRDQHEAFALLASAGYEHHATFVRVSCPDLDRSLTNHIPPDLLESTDETIGHMATIGDAARVLGLLRRLFDARTSHIPPLAELEAMIDDGNVWLVEQNGEIVALLIFKIEGKKFYINHIYNKAGRNVIHSLLLTRIKNAMRQGVNYGYAWIDEKNARSLAFHARYSMKPDGLYSVSYVKTTH